MSKVKWAVCVLVMSIIPMLAWAGLASAQRFDATIDENETVNSSLYSASKNVEVHGTVNGDIFCVGQNVTIDATVRGDVICAGQNVTVNGTVEGDVRVAGQTVAIDSKITGSLTAAAQNFSFDADANVGRDATIMGDSLNLKGTVGRDVLMNGTTLTLNGKVGRDVKANGQQVRMRADTQIAGNLTYSSREEADIAESAQIAGTTTRDPVKGDSDGAFGLSLGMYVYFLAAFLLIALMMVLVFPRAVHHAGETARRHLGKSLLVGIVASLIAPFALLAVAVTFVGLPFAFVLLAVWFLCIVISGPIAGYWLARLILKKRSANIVALVMLGGILLVTLCFVPWIGWVMALLAYWLGFGATLIALKEHMPKPEYKFSQREP